MPRDILLVGGVGLDSAEDVFRTLGKELGPRVKRFTDGETGFARSVWIQCQKPFFFGHPLLEDMEPDPDKPGELRPARVPSKGLYSHTAQGRYAGRSRLRAGVDPADLHFDNIGYGDWAIESYGIFKRLQEAGDVPATSKFQVCLPSIRVILNAHVLPDAVPQVAPAYTAAMENEIARMADAIPHDDFAIQWDCTEPVAYEGAQPGPLDQSAAAQVQRSAGPGNRDAINASLAEYATYVPDDIEMGYHLCYGDFEHKHGLQPPSLAVSVEMSNALAGNVQRPIAWMHMPIPRDRNDDAYFAPLSGLKLHPETRVYLGLIHHTDGVEGTKKRIETANKYIGDYGIATECGWGRRPPETLRELIAIHREVADL
jgi:hypothetical protein